MTQYTCICVKLARGACTVACLDREHDSGDPEWRPLFAIGITSKLGGELAAVSMTILARDTLCAVVGAEDGELASLEHPLPDQVFSICRLEDLSRLPPVC